MRGVLDLLIQDKCQGCGLRGKGFFCQFPAHDLELFESIKVTKAYPRGSMLFVEGQPSRGVFMLCQGKVKLSTCSRHGRVIILEIASAGDVIGLSAAINGSDYETTAEVLEPCQVNYVKTAELLRFLRIHPEASVNAARQLSRNYQTAHKQICSLGLSDSVVDRLAKLFLGWSGNGHGVTGKVLLKNFFTHEEIAEMIGTSRETVTRAIRSFREQDLITMKGSDLVILDRQRLKDAIGNRGTFRSAA
jgi:CRP/FNR family transcriptional regulator, cyclic AMP receptor protein